MSYHRLDEHNPLESHISLGSSRLAYSHVIITEENSPSVKAMECFVIELDLVSVGFTSRLLDCSES